jgi:hypothetical protein
MDRRGSAVAVDCVGRFMVASVGRDLRRAVAADESGFGNRLPIIRPQGRFSCYRELGVAKTDAPAIASG